MTVRQVRPHDRFPSGDSRALLELAGDPSELAVRHALSFEERHDDLDRFLLAAIALPDDSQAWLIRYHGEIGAGTTVYVDLAADPVATKALVLDALSLSERDVRWISPSPATVGRSAP